MVGLREEEGEAREQLEHLRRQSLRELLAADVTDGVEGEADGVVLLGDEVGADRVDDQPQLLVALAEHEGAPRVADGLFRVPGRRDQVHRLHVPILHLSVARVLDQVLQNIRPLVLVCG